MEYCPNGDLQTAIKAHGSLHIECARHYAAETLLALVQLRRQNIGIVSRTNDSRTHTHIHS